MSNGPFAPSVPIPPTVFMGDIALKPQVPKINSTCNFYGHPLIPTAFDAGQDVAYNQTSLPQQMTSCQRGPFSVVTEDAPLCPETMCHTFTEEFLRWVWPESYNPPTALSFMNVRETAVWVEMLSRFKGWREARFYARSFELNGISGYMLSSLTSRVIKSELDIMPYGHRVEIIEAISQNELTLMNPCIVSPSPDVAIMMETCRERLDCRFWQSELCDKLTEHPKWDVKWQPDTGSRPHLSENRRVFRRVMSKKPSFYKKTYGVINSSRMSDFSIKKSSRRCTSIRRVELGRSCSEFIWLNSIQLPPSIVELGVSERMEDFEFQFGPGDNERLSSMPSISELGAKKVVGKHTTCLEILTILADSQFGYDSFFN